MISAQKSVEKKSDGPSGRGLGQSERAVRQAPLHPMLELQQTIGNEAVLQLLRSGGIQAKPTINQSGDSYEQEANMGAEQVVSSSAPPPIQRKCACGGTPGATGECEECHKKNRLGLQTKLKVNEPGDIYEQEADRIADQVLASRTHPSVGDARPRIQRFSAQPTAQTGTTPASVDQVLASPGMPLEPALRQDMEQHFGHDFSQVRLHFGSTAEQSAQDVNANAYTVGHNIVFGAGRFARGTQQGRSLLTHELTHVVQQGHAAAIDGRGVKIAVGRTIPVIQRDTPSGQGTQQKIPPGATKQGGPLSVTKSYDPENASRDEVVQALTDYLNKEWALQGKRRLQVTDRVRTAIDKLFRENPTASAALSRSNLPDSPADLAAKVGAVLPDSIPRKYMMHLYKEPGKEERPTSIPGKTKERVREMIGELGKTPPATGEANRPVEAPSNQPTMGESSGQHGVKTPERPFPGAAPPSPKPDVPQAPAASADKAVNNIVQALDKDALIPEAAKGTPHATNFVDAQEFARRVSDQLAAAEAKKRYTVFVIIPQDYKGAVDLREIYDRMGAIVRQIADVLPGGVKNVNEVIISPAQAPTYRRVVKLHGGD